MLEFCALEVPALPMRAHPDFFDSALRLQRRDSLRGKQQRTLFGFDDYVFEIGMKSQRSIVRQGPRSSGPNDRAHVAHTCKLAFATPHAELYPNRRTGVVFVFDFGLR